jgi:AmiR/NasT family two-component response regulator
VTLVYVDARATAVTIWQAEGVLMELLGVNAAEALWWLVCTAAQRAEPLEAVAAEVVEQRTIHPSRSN